MQPSDVDLVTVGMGGNDAKFGEILKACLFPNMIRELLREYPNPPKEIEWLGGLVSCERLDSHVFHTDDAINALAPKETWAQSKILAAFPTARVLQVNYPNILPAKGGAPATCGGIRKDDLDYARNKVAKIDKVVNQTVQSGAAGSNGRIQIVDVESAFGPNPLCPSNAASALANGVNQANFQAELRRLLNLGPNGDAGTRQSIDKLVDDYNELKRCAKVHYIPFGEDCNVSAATDKVKASAMAVVDRLRVQQDVIFANLMAQPGSTTESVPVRFDRSRGLFHPNALGHEVLACRVLGVFGMGGCPLAARSQFAAASSSDTIGGAAVGNAPTDTRPGATTTVTFGGFAPGSAVTIAMYSVRTALASTTADADGVATATVTMPLASAGVHILEFRGTAAGGIDLTKQALVKYPGRPQGGDSYATYVCCFDRPPADVPVDYREELVDVIYLGNVFATLVPDEDGGVLVEVPLVDPLTDARGVDLQVRSQRTGKTLTKQIDLVLSVAGLWATGSGPAALSITGVLTSVSGRVHSDGDVLLAGFWLQLTGGVEHVGGLVQTSSSAPSTLRRRR